MKSDDISISERKQMLKSVVENKNVESDIFIHSMLELGLEKAQSRESFNPDLLVVPIRQYKTLFNISSAVSINPDNARDHATKRELARMQPPRTIAFLEHRIQVTYSDDVDSMMLLDTSSNFPTPTTYE